MQETWVRSLGREDPLEKEMATHSSTLAWRIPWTEEPGGLQSMGLQELDTTERLNHQPPPPDYTNSDSQSKRAWQHHSRSPVSHHPIKEILFWPSALMFLTSLRQLIIHGASLWHNFVMVSYSQDQTHTDLVNHCLLSYETFPKSQMLSQFTCKHCPETEESYSP